MKKVKKIISAIVLATMLFTTLFASVSCTPQTPEDPPLVKTTTGFSKFEISYYFGPQGNNAINEEYWRMVAECGFTSVPLEHGSRANNKIALGMMKKYGLTCSAIYDSGMKSLLSIGKNLSDEALEKKVKEVVDYYAEFDNLKGWWLYDEPGSDKFEVLGKIVAALKKLDPEREVFIDLFPNYANAEKQLLAEDYADYVNKYLETVNPGYLCYDHYHFLKDKAPRKGFFSNFELIRTAALNKNIDYMSIVLLTEHGTYQDLTRSQILWEANMCLTYGAKRISYFTFILTPELINLGWNNACMSHTGEIYPHYYDVQAVNKKIYPLGNELFNKASEAVFHLTSDASALEKETAAYTSYGKLGSVTGDEFVIGFFNDGSFMITNKKYEEGDAGKNALVFNDISSGLEYFDVESATWKAYTAKNANGNYVFEAMGGEGVLFRVK